MKSHSFLYLLGFKVFLCACSLDERLRLGRAYAETQLEKTLTNKMLHNVIGKRNMGFCF